MMKNAAYFTGILVAVLLTACGGGGEGSAANSDPTGNAEFANSTPAPNFTAASDVQYVITVSDDPSGYRSWQPTVQSSSAFTNAAWVGVNDDGKTALTEVNDVQTAVTRYPLSVSGNGVMIIRGGLADLKSGSSAQQVVFNLRHAWHIARQAGYKVVAVVVPHEFNTAGAVNTYIFEYKSEYDAVVNSNLDQATEISNALASLH